MVKLTNTAMVMGHKQQKLVNLWLFSRKLAVYVISILILKCFGVLQSTIINELYLSLILILP